jgi:hypothetical protein
MLEVAVLEYPIICSLKDNNSRIQGG